MALAQVLLLDVVMGGDEAVDELPPPAAKANTTIAGIHRAARRFRYVGGTPIASPCVRQRWRRYRRNARRGLSVPKTLSRSRGQPVILNEFTKPFCST